MCADFGKYQYMNNTKHHEEQASRSLCVLTLDRGANLD